MHRNTRPVNFALIVTMDEVTQAASTAGRGVRIAKNIAAMATVRDEYMIPSTIKPVSSLVATGCNATAAARANAGAR
jgi:hypothetical protein